MCFAEAKGRRMSRSGSQILRATHRIGMHGGGRSAAKTTRILRLGADIVCYCPPLDNPSQITAITGSMLMFEFVTLIAERLAAKG